ncbi:hypothetical protein AVEN_35996-1 [Araneus ventricosus]|uniref:CCHC-type domain-containing protein n=1 Tax=Araneus ventricosus TaxID=182803 RepID=A0A4Y2N8L0_ARAVE|nr:hypothetical protein AVEN_35996-1 [Araneus ventricosus]
MRAVAALFASCFSWTAIYSHVLAVRGDPLDGWCTVVPSVSIGWYLATFVVRLLRIKRRGHSLGLALRVVIVPGGDSQRIVQVDSKHASVISKLTHLGTFPVETPFHKTLNVSRGVLSNPDFIHVTRAELLEELRDQNVCAARRINIRRDGRLIPTQHVVLTFQTPVLPKSIKAGYINCKLRPYIPNPLRRFKCQRYGHSQQSCRGTNTVCGKCAESGHEINVCTSDTFKCRNCSGPHAASSKSCPTWIFEKEVIAVKIKKNITFPEARQIVKDRTPEVGISYSSTVQMQPKLGNNAS